MHPYRAVPARPTLLWWRRVLALLPAFFMGNAPWYRRHHGGRWYRKSGECPGCGVCESWVRAEDGRCPATWTKASEAERRNNSVAGFLRILERDDIIDEHRRECTCEVHP